MIEEDEEFNRIEREAVMRNVKRTWVKLTDEEIQSFWDGALSPYQMQCIREIEAKLKEKNT
jgi:hypothetical protein